MNRLGFTLRLSTLLTLNIIVAALAVTFNGGHSAARYNAAFASTPPDSLSGVWRRNLTRPRPDAAGKTFGLKLGLGLRRGRETVEEFGTLPTQEVETKCGGRLVVKDKYTPLGAAALDVAKRYPNFNKAQKAKEPSYFDAHPSGALATSHGELQGFGVTMVQGKWPKAVDNASGRLKDPTLLFFQKTGKSQDDWKIIGMGYTFKFNKDNERPPTNIAAFTEDEWWIHEAGYHRSPGDGGFTCASNDDLKNEARDAGKSIDEAGCFGINNDDLKTREFHADKKHGRYWTVHVWFEPKTQRTVVAKTDPWCRQSDEALSVPKCAFFRQGGCRP
jgi:hypothetical protein